MIRLGNENAKHLYEIECGAYIVKVYANNRNQAAAIATKEGYTVHSVNMIG